MYSEQAQVTWSYQDLQAELWCHKDAATMHLDMRKAQLQTASAQLNISHISILLPAAKQLSTTFTGLSGGSVIKAQFPPLTKFKTLQYMAQSKLP